LNFKIHFTTQTLKLLSERWHCALKAGQNQLLKRITALQLLADQLAPALIAQRLGVAVSTV
jgi:transposase